MPRHSSSPAPTSTPGPATGTDSSAAGRTPASVFAGDEYRSRLDRRRADTEREGLAVLLLVGPETSTTSAGSNHRGYFAFTLLVVSRDGPLRLIARAVEAVTIGAQAPGCVHEAFADDADPAGTAERVLRSVTRPGDRVGVEQSSMYFPISIWERMRGGCDNLFVVNGSGLVERLREATGHTRSRRDCQRRAGGGAQRGAPRGAKR